MADRPTKKQVERLVKKLRRLGWRPSGERDEAGDMILALWAEIERLERILKDKENV